MPTDSPPGAPGFARFREHVYADPVLLLRLRRIDDRAAFVEATVALGAERGFRFAAADVTAALQQGQMAWLTHWLPVEP